jgi:Family of unknown function (DUF6074)
MSARIVPFPLARRKRLIDRQVSWILQLPGRAIEKHIAHQLRLQGEALRRKGVAESEVAGELRRLELAIRGAFAPEYPPGAA